MMKKIGHFFAALFLLFSFQARSEQLNTGPWRFELKTTYAEIPFIIDFDFQGRRLTGTLRNGKETIKLKNISYDKKKLSIPLQTYELSLELTQESPTLLTGHLIRHNKTPKILTPVQGFAGSQKRFKAPKKKAEINLSGRWSITLKDEDDKETPGILLFEQDGGKLHGSILTPTGDHRFFEGYVSGNGFQAASFDGVYNYLLRGKLVNEKLQASILSNTFTKIEGKKDPAAKLPDAYAQTTLSSISFNFPDLQGKMTTLNDPKFKNKPVIIQFFGSWCPNCIDEMNFLIPWYAANKKKGIEVIALAFERSNSLAEAKKQLMKTQRQRQVPYTILLAGATSEDKPMDKIKGLKNFISFPTTVFLNRKHEVVKVHAGFSGPSTGEFYETWKKEFNEIVEGLLK